MTARKIHRKAQGKFARCRPLRSCASEKWGELPLSRARALFVSICAGSVRIVVDLDCIKVHGLCAPKRWIGSHFDGHIQERSHGRTWRRHSSVEASARCQNRSSACHSTRAGCRWGAFACTLSVTAKATAPETAVAYRLMLWPDLPRWIFGSGNRPGCRSCHTSTRSTLAILSTVSSRTPCRRPDSMS